MLLGHGDADACLDALPDVRSGRDISVGGESHDRRFPGSAGKKAMAKAEVAMGRNAAIPPDGDDSPEPHFPEHLEDMDNDPVEFHIGLRLPHRGQCTVVSRLARTKWLTSGPPSAADEL